jgi:hypothetical protein
MIVILYQSGHHKLAKKIAEDTSKAFGGHVKIKMIPATSSSSWPADTSWDDLLLVTFDRKDFPSAGNSFINQYLKARPKSAIVLPIAIDKSVRRPPDAAAEFKALEYDKHAKGPGGRLINRIGGILGLRVQKRESKIFISYRAIDGVAIAHQLHDHLTSLGHRAFLDEAKEIDGNTRIIPGSRVQGEIDTGLEQSNLLLLIDTPSAPDSKWIMHEVNTAESLLLPILPICLREKNDTKQGPRFRSLLALQRWIPIQTPSAKDDPPLNSSQLDRITDTLEEYMCEIFKRKCRVPFIVEKEFVSRGFAWRVLDQRLLMFTSSKSNGWRVSTRVLSHCSIFDPNYSPAIKRFTEFLRAAARYNYSLFLYDGDLLPELQLREIVESNRDEELIILHHQELAALIDSNFTNFAAAT